MKRALFLLCFTIIGCGAAPRAAQPKPDPAERTARFRTWGHVTHGYGVDPLTESQAQGIWHWVLRFRGDEVIEALEISPTGMKFRRRELMHDAKGTLTVREFDARGVQKAVRTVDADGKELLVYRTGVVGDDCHHRKLVADARGFQAVNVHYDPSGKELARISCDAAPCFR